MTLSPPAANTAVPQSPPRTSSPVHPPTSFSAPSVASGSNHYSSSPSAYSAELPDSDEDDEEYIPMSSPRKRSRRLPTNQAGPSNAAAHAHPDVCLLHVYR